MLSAKWIGILLVVAALALFAYQNWNYPAPPIRFLIFTFPPIPHSMIIYSCLVIGFVAGWMAHLLKTRKSSKTQAAAPPSKPEG
jgi:cell division protein FtsX|uniref:LapA family protein n=1 Tax=Desulfobacca acetoxidans TaxID=60893 RepID=A0A7C3SJT8_9BACT